jgi:ubiquitin-protein ligase
MECSNDDTTVLVAEQKKFMEVDYELLAAHNFVTDMYFRNPDLLNFMVFTAAHAYVNSSFYHPAFPEIETTRELLKRITTHNSVVDVGGYLPALKIHKNDADFIRHQKDGRVLHRFMCFTLNFNNLFIYPRKLEDGVVVYRVKSLNIDPDPDPDHDEGANLTVFHGTAKTMLYSLIRNGAKTMKTVQNGRSFGDGFYCSPSFSFAKYYSDGFVCAYSLKHPKKYAKTHNIYVVDEPRDLCLTCILPRTSGDDVVETVESGAWRGKRWLLDFVPSHVNSKRLLADIKRASEFFCEEVTDHSIRVEVNEQSYNRWSVFVGNFASDTMLFQDMKAQGVREIELHVSFPNDYPFAPPFVRVVRPRFERWTGHVTYGGSICTEFLTLSDGEYA